MAVDFRELAAEGWVRKSVATEPRLGEIAALYRELGMEVLLVPLLELCGLEDDSGGCATCIEGDADPGRYKVVFTREIFAEF